MVQCHADKLGISRLSRYCGSENGYCLKNRQKEGVTIFIGRVATAILRMDVFPALHRQTRV